MFFRRMFASKDSSSRRRTNDADDYDDNNDDSAAENNNNNNNNNNHHQQAYYRNAHRKHGAATAPNPPTATAASSGAVSSTTQRRCVTASGGPTPVQLTPLWEHILRTRTLPDTVCPQSMFAEFVERLRDAEWQVRQHALRVLVDVLVVMGARADAHMEPLVPQLVENLGHPAPTVRKGALDCLRVYLSETAMPETILLQILDIGLHQKITNEPFGGRLTCGVMLSLPALVQSTLHTSKRHFILRSTIDMLVQKMGQVTHQEITLKVLTKIRALVGEREFAEFMTHGAYREYELLCNVYGVGGNATSAMAAGGGGQAGGSWRFMSPQPNCWRSSDEEQMLESSSQGKVIMETEIKINDDTLTMRILEANEDDSNGTDAEMSPRELPPNYAQSLDDEIVCGRLLSARSASEADGVIQLLSDSEAEDEKRERSDEVFAVVTPSTPLRTPKRVTFGGEVVKMRTPDSDAASSNNNNNDHKNDFANSEPAAEHAGNSGASLDTDSSNGDQNSNSAPARSKSPVPASKTAALSLDIPNDNTKPLPRPRTAQSPQRVQHASMATTQQQQQLSAAAAAATTDATGSPDTSSNSAAVSASSSAHSPIKRNESSNSLSPRSPFKRINISPVDSIVSPKAPHKSIEVLHNLQRDPSPVRAKSARKLSAAQATPDAAEPISPAMMPAKAGDSPALVNSRAMRGDQSAPPKSWEDLGIVDYETLLDLRSGDWRHRLQGIAQLEAALRNSDNLALVQPCRDSLLRTLLSSERNADVAEEKRRLLINLITRLPLDNLEDRTLQIMTGLCRQGDAGANRVCKALMQRLPPAAIVLKLISQEFLHAKSSRFREHALQMVMYALMTFPSTCFDTTTCVTNATYAALNRKRRVRQAALDVLAILGQVAAPRAVLEVVQNVGAQRDDGAALVAAVKARLSRKQLPLVTADGLVQYTLRIPSPQSIDDMLLNGNSQLGPDIEWITAGVGSVSPTSLKRRAYRNRCISQQSFCCLPQREGGVASATGSNNSDDSVTRRYSYRSPPEMCGNIKEDDTQPYNIQHMLGGSVPMHMGGLTAKKPHIDYANYGNRRMVAKSCSDSSMDGRSTDSTHTTSSSGGGGGGGGGGGEAAKAEKCGATGISGRFTRQAVNSRFPAMDLNATYVRVHKPPTYYPGMGAYAHLQQQQYNMNATYPKVNYTMPMQQRRRSQQPHPPQPPPQQSLRYATNHNNNNNNGHNPQQQYFHHKHNANNAQDNFKQTENHSREQNNGIAFANTTTTTTSGNDLDGTYTICTGIAAADSDSGATTATTTTPTPTTTTTTVTANSQQSRVVSQQHHNANVANRNSRRFVNVEKFIMQSNKSSQTNGSLLAPAPAEREQPRPELKQTTPVSLKSSAYSQNSTISADSVSSGGERPKSSAEQAAEEAPSTPTTTLVGELKEPSTDNEVDGGSPAKWTTGEDVLRIEDIVDAAAMADIFATTEEQRRETLQRHESLASLHSNTESIKTQLDETPPVLSRAQSAKSLAIEEDIEDEEGSFVVVDETNMPPTSSSQDSSPTKASIVEADECGVVKNNGSQPGTPMSRPQSLRKRSPTIAELKTLSRRNSMVKSLESLYERPPLKHDPLDSTTETSSQSSSQLNGAPATSMAAKAVKTAPIAVKPQHTPLKQKSKTSHFLKSNRRVSPVKQAIKMNQTELYPSTMQRFDRPREALQKTFDQLDSSSWEVLIVGLKSMVRLMRYHPENLDAQMHMVCIQLTRSVRNLRSQVARAACQAATELFALKSKYMETECDELVYALLHRTGDTNRFLRADAMRALESMCDSLPPVKVLNMVSAKGAQHQNAIVRTTAAKLLLRLVERLGSDRVFAMQRDQRDKFLVTGANLLLEGSLETRNHAKSLFRLLSDHQNFQRLLLEVIPSRTYRNVEKTLKNIKG